MTKAIWTIGRISNKGDSEFVAIDNSIHVATQLARLPHTCDSPTPPSEFTHLPQSEVIQRMSESNCEGPLFGVAEVHRIFARFDLEIHNR